MTNDPAGSAIPPYKKVLNFRMTAPDGLRHPNL
jgi:hypothetical protein